MYKKKYIETPEALMELFIKYKEFTKSNPIRKMVFVGKDGLKDYEEREKPLTMEGFKVFAFKVIGCINQYFDNADKRYNDYIIICRAIKDEIRLDQIEGGMTMIYNPSITQRLNGLVDKSSVEVTKEQPLLPDML